MAYDQLTSELLTHPIYCAWCGHRSHQREVKSTFDVASFYFRCDQCGFKQHTDLLASSQILRQAGLMGMCPYVEFDTSSIIQVKEMNALGREIKKPIVKAPEPVEESWERQI